MQSDLKTVGNCIAEMGHRGKVAGAYLDYLELRAKALVNEHWASIRAVAAALLENKIINEHAVRQVIAGVEARAAAAARKAVMS